MIQLEEVYTPDEVVKVHYQTPEELKIQGHTPEIVHDDDQEVEFGQEQIDIPVKTEYEEAPKEEPTSNFSPIDAIHQVKCDPCSVQIAKYGDKYYIDHKDLKCYMDSCGVSKYESALTNIINAHEDPDLCAESIRIVLGNSDLNNLDSNTKFQIESSTVQFEVYV